MRNHAKPTTLVRDWELMQRLNPLADKPRSLAFADAHPAYDVADLMAEGSGRFQTVYAAPVIPSGSLRVSAAVRGC